MLYGVHDPRLETTAGAACAPGESYWPSVAIFMGTFQGQRFLARQLETIRSQTYPHWNLWVSDDRSTDGTVDILEAHRTSWGSGRLSIRTGPGQGFRANFMSLACDPAIHADYFAFADQDDLWDPEKLAVAIGWLESMPRDVPALYCGRTRLIDENDRPLGLSPLFPKPFVFCNALVQSGAGGNTMVFNGAARALLVEAGADVIVQTHDWWVYLLVSGCGGKVFYDPVPTIGYRQHGQNMVGSNTTWVGRYQRSRRILLGHFRTMNDRNIAALDRMRHRLSPRSVFVLDGFRQARDEWLIPRVLGMLRSGVYCQTRLTNLALIGATVLKKI